VRKRCFITDIIIRVKDQSSKFCQRSIRINDKILYLQSLLDQVLAITLPDKLINTIQVLVSRLQFIFIDKLPTLKLPIIKLNDKVADGGGKFNHNKSNSNISLLSDDKTPLRFPRASGSISPIPLLKSTKGNDDCLSQNSRKLYSNNKYHKGSLLVPDTKSRTMNYQSTSSIGKPKYNKKNIQNKRLNDNCKSGAFIRNFETFIFIVLVIT
jgi:hypothetical protein